MNASALLMVPCQAALVLLLLVTAASAQDSEPAPSATTSCQDQGGECMEGCELGYRDVGNQGCFDSTCCVRPDQSTPSAVVAELFAAAQAGIFSSLANLCDSVDPDGDVRGICALASDPTGADQFVTYFQGGGLVGEATIDGDTATVPFVFGPSDSRSETMNLVRRDGLWYLQSF